MDELFFFSKVYLFLCVTEFAGLTKTLVDSWMLALTDALVVTPGSTFGAVAAMINGRLPYYVDWSSRQCRLTDLVQPPTRYQTNFPAF